MHVGAGSYCETVSYLQSHDSFFFLTNDCFFSAARQDPELLGVSVQNGRCGMMNVLQSLATMLTCYALVIEAMYLITNAGCLIRRTVRSASEELEELVNP